MGSFPTGIVLLRMGVDFLSMFVCACIVFLEWNVLGMRLILRQVPGNGVDLRHRVVFRHGVSGYGVVFGMTFVSCVIGVVFGHGFFFGIVLFLGAGLVIFIGLINDISQNTINLFIGLLFVYVGFLWAWACFCNWIRFWHVLVLGMGKRLKRYCFCAWG
jgi:hypothetical protein